MSSRSRRRRRSRQSERKFNYSCKQFENCTWLGSRKNSAKRDTKQSQRVVPVVVVAASVAVVAVVVASVAVVVVSVAVCLAVYCLLFDVAVCRPLEPSPPRTYRSQKTKAKGVNSSGRGWWQQLLRRRRRREKQFSG